MTPRIRTRQMAGPTRHGTQRGYKTRGCRCELCRAAVTRAEKAYRLNRMHNGDREIDATGTRRRILALGTIGWSQREIAAQSGLTQRTIGRLATAVVTSVHTDTAAAIRTTFARLEMTPGPGGMHVTRAAINSGGLPPLAWDEDSIDDPDATPATCDVPTGIDPVVVARLVSGVRVDARPSEQTEALRVLSEQGMTDTEIAERLRVTERTVLRWRHRDGLESRWAS
jgi:transcriptional regulator with XRE-family HTH domain